MPDKLPRGTPGVAEAHTKTNVVEASLKQLKHDVTGNPLATGGLFIVATELALHDAVLEAKLLLFAQGDREVGTLLAHIARAMLSRPISSALQRFGRSEKRHAETTANFFRGAPMSCHGVLER